MLAPNLFFFLFNCLITIQQYQLLSEMKLFVAIVITFAIASLSVAQPNLVGYWSGEVCEEFTGK